MIDERRFTQQFHDLLYYLRSRLLADLRGRIARGYDSLSRRRSDIQILGQLSAIFGIPLAIYSIHSVVEFVTNAA